MRTLNEDNWDEKKQQKLQGAIYAAEEVLGRALTPKEYDDLWEAIAFPDDGSN